MYPQAIPEIVNSDYFPQMFITQLTTMSAERDKVNYSRFGWMKADDVEVINSMALPLGAERDPFEIESDDDEGQALLGGKHVLFSTNQEMMLIGIALGAVLLVVIMLCLYSRLQAENAALSKDKLSGFSLSQLMARFNNEARFGGRGEGLGYKRVKQTELELTSTPMLDADLDSADLEDMQG